MWWGWWAVSMALASSGGQAKALARKLVVQVGPRPAGSAAGYAAQEWVAAELARRGWAPLRLESPLGTTTYSCRQGRSNRVVLFLAHTDSVHADVPGANDNAAAVAVLLTAISRVPDLPPRTVCVAFPDGEELGLIGSRAFATESVKRSLLGGPLDQVMALDLVGAGALTHNGLGTAWDATRLRELLRVAPAEIPWVYRGVSWALPHMERSDHAPFADLGVPASHLMARGPTGILWSYHTPEDTPDKLSPRTLSDAVQVVRRVARVRPLPIQQRPHDPAVVAPYLGVIDGWWLVVAQGTAFVLGLSAMLRTDRSALLALSQALVAPAAFGLAIAAASAGRPMDAALTPVTWAAGAMAWITVIAAWPWRSSQRGARLLAGLTVTVATAVGVFAGPILGAPIALSALGALLASLPRVGAFRVLGVAISLWPLGYLARPNVLRELAFHGLVPASPLWWALIVAVLGMAPIAAVQGRWLPRRTPWVFGLVGGLTVLAIVVAWTHPVFDTDFPQRHPRAPAPP